MDPRIPPILHPLLQEYLTLLNQELPGIISGVYLEGSLALDGFNPRLSDIDIITVLNSRLSTGDEKKIQGIHQQLQQQYPRWPQSAMYFQESDLGRSSIEIQPFLQYHDGKVSWRQHFALSPVTWWILKNRGIAVSGPPPATFSYIVDMADLLQGQRENMNSYWASWTKRPGRLLVLLSNWGVQWTVLGVLRQFYTLREGNILSKVKACEYALTTLPERWHPIIREAIALRGDPPKSSYPSRISRAVETYRFLQYIISFCNHSTGVTPSTT